jgi:hypothetical protein
MSRKGELRQQAKAKRQADLIDNQNDPARAYCLQKDYFKARKYYFAAATLAEGYGFGKKALYDADMNVRFLRFLSQNEYLRAGTEGTALVQQYSFW